MSATLDLPQLARLTLRDPSTAARTILGWNMPKEALWTAIALVSVVITLLSTLSNLLFPVPGPLGTLVNSPFLYFLIAAGGFLATSYAIFWTGRIMGGQGRIEDLMALLVWLQALRAAAQVAVLLLLIVAPVLASFLVLIVALATLWIFVHFINVALELNSIGRAVAVLVLGAFALVAGLSLVLSMLGFSAVGVPVNV